MSVKIGINGFGRIGRVALRAALQRPEEFEICGINLRKADLDYMVYMIKYDSTYGRFCGEVTHDENSLIINGKHIRVFSESDAANIRWPECGAEYILETTGAYLTTEDCMVHIEKCGAKKVLISAPAKDKVTPTFVMGVNNETYDPSMMVVSNASCTTNCLAPLAKVIHENFGIEQALMTTIHAATSKQKTVDARNQKDWRIGRSVFSNIIPTSTGAAKATALVIPSLKGKITGMAMRIPAADCSLVDLTCRLEKSTSYEEICAKVKEASETYLKGILAYTEDPVVSADIIGESHTSVFDAKAGIMLDDKFVKLVCWYDNEMGYSQKLLDLAKYMCETDNK